MRYAAAGLVNSAAGYAVMLSLGAASVNPYLANAGGFLAGLLVSFVVASVWTFGPARRGGAPGRYAAGFLACYACNLAVVAVALTLGLPEAVAQAGGVGAYAVLFYLTCRWWVYGDAETRAGDAALMATHLRRARI